MRELIINALVSILEGVKGVKRVSRQFENIDEIAETAFPCFIVEDDQPEVIDYYTGDMVTVQLTLNVIGYVRDNEEVSTAINNLDSLLIQKIAQDQTMGGKVMVTTVASSTERSGSQFKPFGYFVRPIKITYETTFTGGL